jgi:hypothetical protein
LEYKCKLLIDITENTIVAIRQINSIPTSISSDFERDDGIIDNNH